MSTKLPKQYRDSKQVRVPLDWHKRLKIEAALRGILIIDLLDQMCRQFFKETPEKLSPPADSARKIRPDS